MKTILVNTADWDAEEHPEVPEGWLIAIAPRPLSGRLHWTGPCRWGTLYAAAPAECADLLGGWERNDARLVEWIDNEVIRARVLARIASHGYDTLEDLEADGIPVRYMAETVQLPWHEEGSK